MNRRLKKWITAPCIVLAVLLAMSGCQNSKGKTIGNEYDKDQAVSDTGIATKDLEESKGEEETAAVNEELTGEITYWTWDKAAPYYAERFTKKYPNVKVNVNVVPDYPTKIKQVLTSGVDVPDVIMVENAQYGYEANDPALENLGEAPYNATEMRSQFYEFWFDSGIGLDGILRVMPNSPGMAANFYRRDIAQEALGTDDPEEVAAKLKTWDDVYEAGLILKEKSKGKRFMVSHASDVYSAMLSQTGKALVEDNKVSTDLFIAPLNMAKKFRDAGIEAKQKETAEISAGMKNGDVMMYRSGSWGESYTIVANVQDTQDGLWGVTDVPGGNVNSGGNGFAIPTAAKNKELAWEFIKFATTDLTMQADQLKKFSCYPAFKEAANDPYFELPVPLFDGQIARKKYGEMGENMVFVPRTKYDDAIGVIMGKYQDDVFNGKLTAEDAVNKMKDELLAQFKELS